MGRSGRRDGCGESPARRGLRTGRVARLAAAAAVALAFGAPLVAASPAGAAGKSPAVGVTDWPAYLNGPSHRSDNAADTAITPANAGTLTQAWHFVGDPATHQGQPGPGYFASPTVANGAVFIGSQTGWFYKLDATTGAQLAKIFIGYQPRHTCSALGVLATATVAPDPVSQQDTVYVAAPDGYLYALSAANLAVKWKSVIAVPSKTKSDYFNWSSPTVANGMVYVGIASDCDNPLVRGGVAGFTQTNGKRFATFYSVPKGVVGGSVWSSVAVNGSGRVFATTGNPQAGAKTLYDSEAIVKLSGKTLSRLAAFQVPKSQQTLDGDFGGSPTLFGPDMGACNKNGIYYTLNQTTMKLAWEQRIGAKDNSLSQAECIAAGAYDGTSLYMAGAATTVHGTAFRGSIMQLNPATGAIGWQTGLPNGVDGSPSMNGGGVITAGTFDKTATPNAEYLFSTADGTMLKTLYTGDFDFAQSVFAGGMLFTANGTGVYGWKL